jgi:folate-binding protein YgfZ
MPAETLLSNLSQSPSRYGLIKVHGDDAESFLQNQLTNEVSNVTENTHQLTAWCSPKGRIIATFRLFKRDNAYFLSLSEDLLEHVIKKLSMYVMMSKVTLEDVTESFVHLGVSGESAEQDLKKLLTEELPSEADGAKTINGLTVLKLAGTIPRYAFFSEAGEAKVLTDSVKQAPDNYWQYLNIVAGIPSISQASSEAWIPQMVNFIQVNGVDFKKGCYPGQEIVARLNYLGKTKRRMYRLLIDSDQLPAINDVITSENEKDAGKILNAVINPDGKAEALAVMKIAEIGIAEADSLENNASLKLANNEASITLLELPYTVNDS